MNPKNVILVCLTGILLLCFASCQKSSSTSATGIVGTWAPSMQTAVETQNHVFVKDTSFVLTPAIFRYSTLAFTSGGQYSWQPYPSGAPQTGNYTYTGGILDLTTGPAFGKAAIVLSGNTFSFSTIDTPSTSPLTIDSIRMFFSRQ